MKTTFEVQANGIVFGIYEADSAQGACDACAIDAGYKSEADMAAQLEQPSELVAAAIARAEGGQIMKTADMPIRAYVEWFDEGRGTQWERYAEFRYYDDAIKFAKSESGTVRAIRIIDEDTSEVIYHSDMLRAS